jgi:hypothetical protein
MEEEKEVFSSMTLIKDPSIEPYFIGKDGTSYTVYQTVYPGTNKKGRGRKTRTKEGIKPLTYHSTLSSCLASIAKLKVDNRPIYNTIHEYISEWERVKEEISNMINLEL